MPFYRTFTNIDWYYTLEGRGAPLVFIHGWGVNHRIWRQQIKYFNSAFNVLGVDLPGHGQTQYHTITFEDMVYGLIDIINALELAPVTLIGSSLGGLVALKVYDVCPQIVKSMVFVGSQPKFARSADYPTGLDIASIRKLAQQIETHYPNMLNIFFRSLFTRQERATRRFKWIQTFRKADFTPDQKALLEMLNILETQDLRGVLDKIKVPVQFINGTEDTICPRSVYEKIKSQLPAAQFDWFEQCGHFPFLSRPHEFNRVLECFLCKVYPQAQSSA